MPVRFETSARPFHGLVKTTGGKSQLYLKVFTGSVLNQPFEAVKAPQFQGIGARFINWLTGVEAPSKITVIDQLGRQQEIWVDTAQFLERLKTMGINEKLAKAALADGTLLDKISFALAVREYIDINKKFPSIDLDKLKQAYLMLDDPTFSAQGVQVNCSQGRVQFTIDGHSIDLYATAEATHGIAGKAGLHSFSPTPPTPLPSIAEHRVGQALKEHLGIEESRIPEIIKRIKDQLALNQQAKGPYRREGITIISPDVAMLETDHKIGSGSFKTQVLAIELFSGKLFATYKIPEANPALREVETLEQQEKWSGVLRLAHRVGYKDQQGTLYTQVYTKYYAQGALRKTMNTAAFTPEKKLKLAKYLAKALAGMHRKGYVHRDLKPENIFVRENKAKTELKPVIGDLGSVVSIKKPEDIQARADHTTTSWYASPAHLNAYVDRKPAEDAMRSSERMIQHRLAQIEDSKQRRKKFIESLGQLPQNDSRRHLIGNAIQALEQDIAYWKQQVADEKQLQTDTLEPEYRRLSPPFIQANDKPLDVWSLGIIYYELFCGGKPPWIVSSDEVQIQAELARTTFPISVPPTVPPEMRNLIQAMLCKEDARRLTMEDVERRIEAIS